MLRIAGGAGRVLLSHYRGTMPRHFARFRETRSSAGVIIVSQDLDIAAVIEDLLIVWAASDMAEWMNQLGFLPL